MRQVWIPRPGPPEVLALRETRDPLPAPGEVRIRVHACGVNYPDVCARMGLGRSRRSRPLVPGLEVAGRIDTVGEEVETDWIGRDVFALTAFGGYSDVVCVSELQTFARPKELSAREAAAFAASYLMAYQAIEVMGSLKPDESVLVYSAGGGLGSAAIQLAQHIGARVIAASSAHKQAALESLGVDWVEYAEIDTRVGELTGGRGVDLVLNGVGGASLPQSYRALAHGGRLALLGTQYGAPRNRRSRWHVLRARLGRAQLRASAARLMRENRAIFGVDLTALMREIEHLTAWIEKLTGLCEANELRPRVDAVFPLESAAEAHAYLQDRRNTGKILLLCEPEASSPAP